MKLVSQSLQRNVENPEPLSWLVSAQPEGPLTANYQSEY